MSVNNERATDEAEIRDLVENWARAVRTKNLHGILADHSPEILMFDVPPPAQSMGLEVQSWRDQDDQDFGPALTRELREQEERLRAQVAEKR